MAGISSDIIRGYNDTIILYLLLDKPSYGYEISKQIKAMTNEKYIVKETTLYSAFTRMEKNGYITSFPGVGENGGKKLDLKEVYCGLDCQMLLYLFSLTRDKSGRFTGAEPAGVLYLLADPAPETTTREKAAHSVEYKLDGLVRDEQKLFDAMDADETGRYLPFSYYKGAPSPYQKDKRADIAKLNRIQLHLDDLVTRMGQQLYEGQIAAEPLVAGRSPCQWCDYGFVCCHETGIGERALEAPAKPFEAPGQPEEGEEEQA